MAHRIGIAARLLVAYAAMRAPGALGATVEGTLSFPDSFVPPMLVYARESQTGRLHHLLTQPNQTTFRLTLPEGSYWFFAEPGLPGAPHLYGAYTEAAICRRHQPAEACTDHQLATVVVGPRAPATGVAIEDWAIPDTIGSELDRMLGESPNPGADELGAPRFSEYPATIPDNIKAPHPALDGLSPGAVPQNRLREALQQRPNFAGSYSLLAMPCGPTCVNVALVDWHSGKVVLPAVLEGLATELPCRTEASLEYRADSRLVRITRKRDASIVTQYVVWKGDGEGFAQIAEYQRSVERFCSAPH